MKVQYNWDATHIAETPQVWLDDLLAGYSILAAEERQISARLARQGDTDEALSWSRKAIMLTAAIPELRRLRVELVSPMLTMEGFRAYLLSGPKGNPWR